MLDLKPEQIDQVTAFFYELSNGKIPPPLDIPEAHREDEWGQLIEYINRFAADYAAYTEFVYALSRGDLTVDPPRGRLQMLQSFKSLQANLKHLTWKTQQIAKGDFSHKVDFMGDFSEAFNDMTGQLKNAFETIQNQNKALQEANEVIAYERAKSDALLDNILPSKIVDELKENGATVPQVYPNVTVYFSDIVGFTDRTSNLEAATLISELNTMFAQFDCIVDATYGERIKTIGDAYMAVWGMHTPLDNHEEKAVEAALRIVDCLKMRNKESDIKWEVRIGIHSGPVIGGVVGVSKFIYDVFGDTVNTASRLESSSEAMKINISDAIYQKLSDRIEVIERGVIPVKGKGEIKMYYVSSFKKQP